MAETEQKTKKQRKGVKSFIGGTILTDERVTRQIPFIFFLALLGIILITNRNWSERTIRKIEVIQDSIRELRSEAATVSAKLMEISRPSEVVARVKSSELGLIEPTRPPKKITISKK
jgi:hypothetical protein